MIKNKILLVALTTALLVFAGCKKDFEELNKNPYATTITSIGPLFNNVTASLRLGWNEQFYIHNEVLYPQTQLAALTSQSWSNLSIGTEETWTDYYVALAHIRDIERRLEAIDNPAHPDSLDNVRAMVKILLAYKTFRVTDLFGDMPFFGAGRGYEGTEFLHPVYDSQEDIYLFLLDELKWASEHISLQPESSTGGTFYSIAAYDKLFDGQLLRWRKFANSLRLRHAMRISEKRPELAAEIISDIINNNLPVIKGAENVVMMPRKQNWLRVSTNWSFREHKNLRMGTTIRDAMSNNDSINGSGFFDPRAFLFFETNNAGNWKAFPQIPDANTPPAGGIPYGLHRDQNYTIKGTDNIYSPFNYYLIRDENDVPEIIITGAEYHFILSEAYFRGIGMPQDANEASAEYFTGVIASMEFWDQMHDNSAIWLYTSPLYEQANPYDAANKIFFLENDEEKLDLLYEQRWLDAFRQPWEAYSLVRRTNRTPRVGAPLNFFRLPYPPSESEHNSTNWSAQSAVMGGDVSTVKVWWME